MRNLSLITKNQRSYFLSLAHRLKNANREFEGKKKPNRNRIDDISNIANLAHIASEIQIKNVIKYLFCIIIIIIIILIGFWSGFISSLSLSKALQA